MELIISNKIKVKDAPKSLTEVLTYELKVDNPKYLDAQSQGYSTYGIDKHIYNFSVSPDGHILVPRGYKKNLISLIDYLDIKATIIDETKLFEQNYNIDSSKIQYRPYQSEAVVKLISEREGLLVSPAGSGKTIMGISLVPLLGQPTLWLTHTDRLVKQTMEKVETFLPSLEKEDVGYIGGGKWNEGNIFTIATVQTLSQSDRLYELKDHFGLVVCDETHHVAATTFLKVICQLNPYYLYGLTATPYRRDKLESLMTQTMGDIAAVVNINDVRKYGGVILPTVFVVDTNSDFVDGNNIQEILKYHVVENNKRNKLIVSNVLTEAKNGNCCIVISDRKAHCEILYNMIKKSWDKTSIATGAYNKKHIDAQVAQFFTGETTVLVATFSLLGEGFDVDILNRAFIAMPFRTEAKAEQLIGRVQRIAEGKTEAIVYDYLDSNIGVLRSQFHTNSDKECRRRVYERLGVEIIMAKG